MEYHILWSTLIHGALYIKDAAPDILDGKWQTFHGNYF